jgi:hypothetical protein
MFVTTFEVSLAESGVRCVTETLAIAGDPDLRRCCTGAFGRAAVSACIFAGVRGFGRTLVFADG